MCTIWSVLSSILALSMVCEASSRRSPLCLRSVWARAWEILMLATSQNSCMRACGSFSRMSSGTSLLLPSVMIFKPCLNLPCRKQRGVLKDGVLRQML